MIARKNMEYTGRIVSYTCVLVSNLGITSFWKKILWQLPVKVKMIPKFSYWLKGKLYINVTNNLVCKSPISLRGPKFEMPSCSGFMQLPEGFEPSADDIFKEVDDMVALGKVKVDSMQADPVTFAGNGEPLLRLDDITKAAQMIKESRHGLPLRVRTSGLIESNGSDLVARLLKSSGIKQISVALISDNPKQYQDIVQPTNGLGFGDVCNFIIACNSEGIQVTCSAIERPDVSMSKVRALSTALGATNFVSYSYHE